MRDLSGSEILRAFAPVGSLLWQCTTPLFSRAGLGRRQQNTFDIRQHHGARVTTCPRVCPGYSRG
jgi:hypothetical protein